MSVEKVSCALCGSDDYTLLFEGRDRIHEVAGVFPVVQCNKCNLVYLNPRPGIDSISEYYPEEYSPFESEGRSFTEKLQAWLRRREAKRIAALLPSSGRVIEIGCASGDLLRPLRDQCGLSVCGVEMSEYAAGLARDKFGLDVHTGTMFDSPYPDGVFDAVIMRHVVEHFHAPRSALKRGADHLRPGGLIVISTPNFDSLDRRVFDENWYDYDTPRHLTLFSTKTLIRMLEEEGFAIQAVHYSVVPNNWIYSLRYVLETHFGKRHIFKYLSIKNPFALVLFMPLGLIAKMLRQSGRMEIIAVKSR